MTPIARERHIEMIACPAGETSPANDRNSEGSVIELTDGRLFMVYSNFTAGAHDFAVSDIQGKISEDGGATWCEPFVVQPNDARINVMIASLLRLGTYGTGHLKKSGGLALFYVKHETKYTDGIYFRLSRNEAATWSKEVRINEVPTLAHLTMRNDTPILHSSGRIIVPTQGSFGGLYGSVMYFSDDEGLTWQRSEDEVVIRQCVPFEGELARPGGIPVGYSHCEEPAVVELKDGRVMLFGRTMMGRIHRAFSEDRGNTWTDAEPTDLASSCSPCTLKRIPSTGDLVCIWNQVSTQEIEAGYTRCRMSLAVSKDEAETWEHFRSLESMDDTVRVEAPPLDTLTDAAGEAQIIQSRAVVWRHRNKPPLDPKRYCRKGYPHIDYPACAFTSDDHVVISYGCYGGTEHGLTPGNKVVIHPVQWLYEA